MPFIVDCRKFLYSLVFTKEGDLDLGWLFTLIMGLSATFIFVFEAIHNGHASIAGWSFMGSAFSAVLIASVPIAKARILANSRMIGDVASGIAQSSADDFQPHQWDSGDPNSGTI